MKKMKFLIYCFLLCQLAAAQSSDNAFKKPLKDIITQMENRFSIKIRYPEDLVKDRWVTYAEWRFRPDAEITMANIFASQDITFVKEGYKKYKLQSYQYHLKTPAEGKEQLNYFAKLYNDKKGWEARSIILKECILNSLQLSVLPAKPLSQPILSAVRKMNGYTIQNIAIEVLEGVYVCGSLYSPAVIKGKIPVILNPDGHFEQGRYRADCQYRCAMLAKMGAMAFSYDLFAWGESLLQFTSTDHRKAIAQSIQALNAIRILDYLLSLKNADPQRVAITGGSGGGSHAMLVTAIDSRVKLSVPVVMLSSYHSGGCPCESGMGVHLCGNGTNNVEIAGMAAPRPQLIISDGKDWTQYVPETEFPYLQKIYNFYGSTALLSNAHLASEGHDYGSSKRKAMYEFIARYFKLNLDQFKEKDGKINETGVTIEKETAMYVFGEKGQRLPANSLKNVEDLQKLFDKATKKK